MVEVPNSASYYFFLPASAYWMANLLILEHILGIDGIPSPRAAWFLNNQMCSTVKIAKCPISIFSSYGKGKLLFKSSTVMNHSVTLKCANFWIWIYHLEFPQTAIEYGQCNTRVTNYPISLLYSVRRSYRKFTSPDLEGIQKRSSCSRLYRIWILQTILAIVVGISLSINWVFQELPSGFIKSLTYLKFSRIFTSFGILKFRASDIHGSSQILMADDFFTTHHAPLKKEDLHARMLCHIQEQFTDLGESSKKLIPLQYFDRRTLTTEYLAEYSVGKSAL